MIPLRLEVLQPPLLEVSPPGPLLPTPPSPAASLAPQLCAPTSSDSGNTAIRLRHERSALEKGEKGRGRRTEGGDDGETLCGDSVPQELVEACSVALLQGGAGGEEGGDGRNAACCEVNREVSARFDWGKIGRHHAVL